jgi:membrane dipeptidase
MNFFDLHADVPLVLDSEKPQASAVDLVSYPFEKYNQVMAIFLNENIKNPFNIFKRRLNLTKEYLNKYQFPILKQNINSLSGAILSVENAGFLADDINLLYNLKSDGISFLSLTWNSDNLLASGANGDGGISSKGKEVIKLMNELGLALDISHLSHKSAMEGVMLADRVLASHSALYSLNAHNRNIKDDVLLALKQKNGIIGLCLYPPFLGGGNVISQLLNSVEYLFLLGMEKNIAIGTDFDGADMAVNLSKTAHIPNLFDAFCSYGLKKSVVEDIFYKNAIAFFSKICENKLL